MAYFDSEKNKAMWEKRMGTLRNERDRRKAEGYKPGTAEIVKEEAAAKPGVRVINLKELMAKEAAKNAAMQPAKAPRHERTMQRQMQQPTMSR